MNSQLRIPRKDVEGILKHFLDSGNQFHFTPSNDPGLLEAERLFETWSIDAKEALARCFTTDEIIERFERFPVTAGPQGVSPEQARYRVLMSAYDHRREYLKRLKGTLAMYEISEMKSAVQSADRHLMVEAIDLARNCVTEPDKASPSPKVGAIIVRDGVVLGRAYRGELAPGEHAEFTLLEKKLAGQTLAGATLYTTLEPCTSRNHPKLPCAQWIVDHRIKRVVIGTLDRNPDIRGRGEIHLLDAGIEVARFDSDLLPVIEELNREFIRDIRGRTKAETKDPVDAEAVGPNGFKIGYTENGDKVEWIEEDGETWPMILRRNDNDILAEYNELWDKIWYIRNLIRIEREGGEISDAMRRVEEKYGKENLGWDDVEWGIMQGKMATLAWVMGSDWDGAFDT